jgi:hypothetical protein
MTSPNPAEVRVATHALRTEADLWDEQGDGLETVSINVDDLALGGLESGVFRAFAGPYNDVVHQVASRSREGVKSMRDISATLRLVANTYDNEDAAAEHWLRGLY